MGIDPSNAFTSVSPHGLLNVLKNDCGISEATDPSSGDTLPDQHQFKAIWDTGATNSVITQKVVDDCGLKPTGMGQSSGVHGMQKVETFLVNIYLPNKVIAQNMRVSKGQLPDADVLIGMDVISRGDFAVTHKGGKTKFSFRVPSIADIDFVKETKATQAKIDRNKNPNRAKRMRRKARKGKN